MRAYFAGLAMQAMISKLGVVPNDKIAADSYALADAMVKTGEQEEKEQEITGQWRVMFIGGDRHGEIAAVESVPVIEHKNGQYHRHFLGLEGPGCFRMVYLWSELSAEDVVDLLFRSLSESEPPSAEGAVTLVNNNGRTILTIDNGITRLSIQVDKEVLALLAEGCANCFNSLNK